MFLFLLLYKHIILLIIIINLNYIPLFGSVKGGGIFLTTSNANN
jgi:hypothetical protein